MRCVFATLALVSATEECDEVALLQVKTHKTVDPMGTYGAQTAGEYGAQTAGEYGAQTAGEYGAQTAGEYGAQTAGEYGAQTAGEYGAPPSAYGATYGEPPTYGDQGPDHHEETMDGVAADVTEEFGIPKAAVDEFMSDWFPQVYEEFQLGDEPFIEETVMEFCMENGGTECHELAAEAVDFIIDEFHNTGGDGTAEYIDTYEQELPDQHLSDCERWSIWDHEECDDVMGECWSMGPHLHLNDVKACMKSNKCVDEDWKCHEQAWNKAFPGPCEHPVHTEYGMTEFGLPTIEEVAGAVDNVCRLEHKCIDTFGWDHIDMYGWEEVDACVCKKFHKVDINHTPEESWHVDYFSNYCMNHDGAAMPDMNGDGTFPNDMYTLMQRVGKMSQKGLGKKFLQSTGRRVNVRQFAKAQILKALKAKLA